MTIVAINAIYISLVNGEYFDPTWEEREWIYPYIAGVSECGRRKATEFYFLEAQILAV